MSQLGEVISTMKGFKLYESVVLISSLCVGFIALAEGSYLYSMVILSLPVWVVVCSGYRQDFFTLLETLKDDKN